MSKEAKVKNLRLLSLSWAELGTRYRSALLAKNTALASRIKQAIELKDEFKKMRKNGTAVPRLG